MYYSFYRKLLQILKRKGAGSESPMPLLFVNSPSVLPEPLNKEDEERIYQEILSGNEEAREELITRNLRLVVYIAKKFENANVAQEDLISIGTIGLIKAVRTFCPDRNIKLATYASRCIENEILMYLRKTSNIKTDISLDEPLNVDWDGNELLLSDILYSDEDIVFSGIETSDEGLAYMNRLLRASGFTRVNAKEKITKN